MKNFIFGAVVILGLFYLFSPSQLRNLSGPPGMETLNDSDESNRKIVDLKFSIQNTKGETVQLADIAKDKVVFINFWATWCPPCVAEMPSIQKLVDMNLDKVAIVCVTDESTKQIESFLKKNQLTIPCYRLVGQRPKSLTSHAIPATFIVNQKQELVYKHVGAADWSADSVVRSLQKFVEMGSN